MISLETTNIVNEEYEDKSYEKKYHEIKARMHEQILLGKFGAMRTDDEATRGCYLVKWLSERYTI